METVETRHIPTEFRVEKKEKRTVITGYSAVFNKDSEDMGFVERIAPGAFTDALKGSDIRALFNHNPDFVLGRQRSGTLRMSQDDKGLLMELDPPDTSLGRDLMTLIERGDIGEQSFSFIVEEERWENIAPDSKKTPKRTIVKVKEVRDVGPVTFPAYRPTDVSVALRSLEQARGEAKDEPSEQIEIVLDSEKYVFTDEKHLQRMRDAIDAHLNSQPPDPTVDGDAEADSPTTSDEGKEDTIITRIKKLSTIFEGKSDENDCRAEV